VNPKLKDYLAPLNPEASLHIVSMVGKYRTGKSYLMNQLFKGKADFEVGNSVNSCTKVRNVRSGGVDASLSSIRHLRLSFGPIYIGY
jgi:hypothetical protein